MAEIIFNIDPDYMQKCIIKSAFQDKQYSILISQKFKPEYFDNDAAGIIFWKIKEHINEYKNIPQQEIIINSITKEDEQENVQKFLYEINSIDFNVENNYEWLYENTNNYLKDRAFKYALMQSIDIVESKKGELQKSRDLIEEALCADLKINLGLNYFDQLGERLKEIFTASNYKVPSFYPTIDEIINNGFIPYSLSVWAAVTHAGKSQLLTNMISRQILNGYNCVLFTMEMSELSVAQRLDSIYSYLDINKMYVVEKYKKELTNKLKEVKSNQERGDIYIKEFPTGKATVNDFRIYLRELDLRGIKPSIIYADYINIMSASQKNKNQQTHEDITEIVRDLRALSLEWQVPVVSVTQINREGGFLNLKELDFNYIAGSIGIPQDSDFVGILGYDPDKLNYESELHYKIVKNRLGGRVGTIGKLYTDTRNLRIYDDVEFDQWIQDARRSGDERNTYTPKD